jgi:hypothetical protein
MGCYSNPRFSAQEYEEHKYAAESKLQEAQGDTKFVLNVQLTTNVTYVSVEELTKGWVSFNPNPHKLPPRST